MKDAGAAILEPISEGTPLKLEEVRGKKTIEDMSFCEPWDRPTWVYLGKWPFESEEEGWPPPCYWFDVLDPESIQIYHKGNLTRTRDRSTIVGMRKSEGLLFPGHLVVKIRELNRMKVDRREIVKFAPLSTGWKPHAD